MKKPLWGGRFSKGPAEATVDFNSAENVILDQELIPYDILGSIAHVKMLYRQEILSTKEYEDIIRALKLILSSWKRGEFVLRKDLEDVHMNIEAWATKITESSKKMHTARSRNDQVMLDMRLFMRDKTLEMIDSLEGLQEAFAELSKREGPFVAYTHTRVAQPITVSFWCEGWLQSLERDKERLMDAYKRINQNPLGACAISGTSWNIDRDHTAKLLAFEIVQENALDTITSRGECEAELLSVLSLIMCKLSRLGEELIWLSEKGLVKIAEEHTTGSSIMPNKKNPDVLELVRGRTGRVYGNLIHCLTALKGLPSGYHSDMQETKSAAMGGVYFSVSCVNAMAMVVRGLRFDKERIERELEEGFAQATEIADYLAMGGLPFREAHERSGNLVKFAEKKGKTIGRLGQPEAEKILGVKFPEGKWIELKSLSRKRLMRKVRARKSGFVKAEREKIEKAFSSL